VACNLSNTPPTPTVAPANEIPLVFPSVTPLTNLGATPIAPAVPVEGANPNCPPPPGWVPYTVEAGDSMGLLAEQTDSTTQEIMQGNCLSNPDEIFVDQVLYLPRTPVVSQ
jgi:LysM repeat protein